MAYTVLARRYRSQDFDEVVGQEPIARTLRNAIDSGRVAHAYLFCGTRGVGKTSMARIFAKALNAPSASEASREEVERAIMTGRDADVIEIDAASNRGVEDARELIANCVYLPMRGPYKVYIIDEVHMLTREASNALLKTMEEPPPHVKFILCTTEPEKLLPTIRSRCQRFDFRDIPTTRIAGHLQAVIEQEKRSAEPELLHALARMASGSMRDALSLLDRLLAVGDQTLTLASLEEILGLPPRDLLSALIDAIASADAAAALESAHAVLASGVSPEQVLGSLAQRFRDLLLLAACGPDSRLVDLSEQTLAEENQRAGRFDPAGLTHLIAVCASVQRSLRDSPVARPLFDAAVVRMALAEHVADVASLLAGGGDGEVRAGKA